VEPNTLIALALAGGIFCIGLMLIGGETSNTGKRFRAISGKQSGTSNLLEKIKVDDKKPSERLKSGRKRKRRKPNLFQPN